MFFICKSCIVIVMVNCAPFQETLLIMATRTSKETNEYLCELN